jgi:hypothetical protein
MRFFCWPPGRAPRGPPRPTRTRRASICNWFRRGPPPRRASMPAPARAGPGLAAGAGPPSQWLHVQRAERVGGAASGARPTEACPQQDRGNPRAGRGGMRHWPGAQWRAPRESARARVRAAAGAAPWPGRAAGRPRRACLRPAAAKPCENLVPGHPAPPPSGHKGGPPLLCCTEQNETPLVAAVAREVAARHLCCLTALPQPRSTAAAPTRPAVQGPQKCLHCRARPEVLAAPCTRTTAGL